jgi:lipase
VERLHAQEWGDPEGAPVVCLHGVMGHGGRFRRLAEERLASRRVIALDLRGHGRSTWDPPWNLETHLEDLRLTLDALGLGPVDLVGFSFGGRLALELAATDSERVRSLALLDPAIQIAPAEALALADEIRPEVTFADVDEAIEARAAFLAHTPREMLEEDMAAALEPCDDGRLRYRVARSAVVTAYGEMARPPALPSARPTLLVRGAEGLVGDEHERLLGGVMGDALVVEVVPGGHSVLWDAYPQTASAVAAHLGA